MRSDPAKRNIRRETGAGACSRQRAMLTGAFYRRKARSVTEAMHRTRALTARGCSIHTFSATPRIQRSQV
jgi:hypothetical protein